MFTNNVRLTKREKEIIELIQEQYFLNEELAEKLNISTNTVKKHLNSIYTKLILKGNTHSKKFQLIWKISKGLF